MAKLCGDGRGRGGSLAWGSTWGSGVSRAALTERTGPGCGQATFLGGEGGVGCLCSSRCPPIPQHFQPHRLRPCTGINPCSSPPPGAPLPVRPVPGAHAVPDREPPCAADPGAAGPRSGVRPPSRTRDARVLPKCGSLSPENPQISPLSLHLLRLLSYCWKAASKIEGKKSISLPLPVPWIDPEPISSV